MKGYIYKLYAGADPSVGWTFNDPIFGQYSTLGACMPNIRRLVDVGDWIFAISGKVPEKVPYVVGGFKVDEKIDALEAHARFPEYRLQRNEAGQIVGNIIVNKDGEHHPLDDHDNFDRRKSNYLVGKESVVISEPSMVERARGRSHAMLEGVLRAKANRFSDLVPRWRKLDEGQVKALLEELNRIRDHK